MAMGFTGAEKGVLLDALGVEMNSRGNIAVRKNKQTNVPKVFAAGDVAHVELDGKLDRGHGMASMKHRAKQMQGQCLVESGPGYGTVIRLTLPL